MPPTILASTAWRTLLFVLCASLLLEQGITANHLMPGADSAKRAALLALHAPATTSLFPGRDASVLGGVNDKSASCQADVASDILSTQPGQTLLLNETEVCLDSTLTIASSDIVIRGADGMTTVHCPAEGGAFVLK